MFFCNVLLVLLISSSVAQVGLAHLFELALYARNDFSAAAVSAPETFAAVSRPWPSSLAQKGRRVDASLQTIGSLNLLNHKWADITLLKLFFFCF